MGFVLARIIGDTKFNRHYYLVRCKSKPKSETGLLETRQASANQLESWGWLVEWTLLVELTSCNTTSPAYIANLMSGGKRLNFFHHLPFYLMFWTASESFQLSKDLECICRAKTYFQKSFNRFETKRFLGRGI